MSLLETDTPFVKQTAVGFVKGVVLLERCDCFVKQTAVGFAKGVVLLERCDCFVKQTAVGFVKGVLLLERCDYFVKQTATNIFSHLPSQPLNFCCQGEFLILPPGHFWPLLDFRLL